MSQGALTPPARLRIELSRRRDRGEHFEAAWPGAIENVLADDPHAEQWRATLSWARFAFENGYCHRGPARLADAVQARELAEVVAETVRPAASPGGRRLVA